MQEGAFALIDCLGFKGIWNRPGITAEQVISKLRLIEKTVQEGIETKGGFLDFSETKLVFKASLLSDSIAISLTFGEDKKPLIAEPNKGYLVSLLCVLVVKILALYIKEKPHLVMRGCISYGEFISDGNFIVGPAVDRAAEHMNIAEGAFVWLLPNVAALFEIYVENLMNAAVMGRLPHLQRLAGRGEWGKIRDMHTHQICQQYEMPLKGGGFLTCSVINPFYTITNEETAQNLFNAYLEALEGERMDIWLKKQNTLRFLEFAKARNTDVIKSMNPFN